MSNIIPIVDLGDQDEQNLTRNITKAGHAWGMFQVVNHDIPAACMSNMQAAGVGFFQLPPAQKEAYGRPPNSASIEGYGAGLQGACGEHLFHRAWPPHRVDHRFWPGSPVAYRAAVEEYVSHVRVVADVILRLLSLGLGLEAHALKEAVGGSDIECLFKINYYPPCPIETNVGDENKVPKLKFGVNAHTDLCALTILVPNQVTGLQVLSDDDRWIDVDYVPNALIIHIGDQIEIASNGFYKSVMHRSIVDKEKTRMSWPVFFEPPPHFTVGPIPQLLNHETSPKYNSNKFKNYAHNKLNPRLYQ